MSEFVGKVILVTGGTGMAEAFKKEGIATQTLKEHFSPEDYSASRDPSIMADAAFELLRMPSGECTGQFFIDEELLRKRGTTDFSQYALHPGAPLMQSLFLSPDQEMLPVSGEFFS